jgi:hypothetical protein
MPLDLLNALDMVALQVTPNVFRQEEMDPLASKNIEIV